MEREIKFVNIQFVIFFNEPIRPEILSSDFLKEMGDVFDQPPLTIPIPNSPEFVNTPIVQFTSSDSLHACNFARQRADYFHYSSDRKKQYKFEEIEDNFLLNMKKYFNFFSKNGVIGRIGFITHFFIEDEEKGKVITNLINSDFKKIHNGDARSAGVDYISRIKTKDNKFELNNRTFIQQTGITFYDDSKQINRYGILIIKDFNTVPEKNNDYRGMFNDGVNETIFKEVKDNFKLKEISEILWKEKKEI